MWIRIGPDILVRMFSAFGENKVYSNGILLIQLILIFMLYYVYIISTIILILLRVLPSLLAYSTTFTIVKVVILAYSTTCKYYI